MAPQEGRTRYPPHDSSGPSVPSEAEQAAFDALSPVGKLRQCHRDKRTRMSPDVRRARLAIAMVDSMNMGPTERAAKGIRLVALGPQRPDGTLDELEYHPVGAIVEAVFPIRGGSPRLLSTNNEVLSSYVGVASEQLINGVDAFHQETPAERMTRLVLGIKHWDQLIAETQHGGKAVKPPVVKRQTRRTALDRLRSLKTLTLNDFFNTAQTVETTYPDLLPVFGVSYSRIRQGRRLDVEMRMVEEPTGLERAIDRRIPEHVVNGRHVSRTMMNVAVLQSMEERYQADPSSALPDVLAGHQIYEFLQRPGVLERRRPSAIRRPDRRREGPRFAEQPTAMTTHVNEKSDHKDAMARRHVAIRSVIDATPQERAAKGIELVVVGPLTADGELAIADPDSDSDPNYTEYRVYAVFQRGEKKVFLDAPRRALVNPQAPEAAISLAQLQQLDASLGEGVRFLPEEPIDTYKRTIAELTAIDARINSLIAALRGRQQSTVDGELSELRERKYSILASYLDCADAISTLHPELHPVYRMSTYSGRRGSETFVRLHMEDVIPHGTVKYFNEGLPRGIEKAGTYNTQFLLLPIERAAASYATGDPVGQTDGNYAAAIIYWHLFDKDPTSAVYTN